MIRPGVTSHDKSDPPPPLYGSDDLLVLVRLLLVGCGGAAAEPGTACQQARNEKGNDSRRATARECQTRLIC